ncbi:MAG: hypothetical protein Kow0069_14870 [Promethearchaeota archaeon]
MRGTQYIIVRASPEPPDSSERAVPVPASNASTSKWGGPEALLERLLHNPRLFKRWWRKLKTGVYYRWLGSLRGLSRLFGFRYADFDFLFVATTHLDSAWLWTKEDGRERAIRTFEQVVENCRRFPFLVVSVPAPQHYAWVKEGAPELWRRVKELVASGRLEPTGGMWVEPDLELSSGESLVRQRLHGCLFFLREFGRVPKVASLLDVFGFPHSLPQILVKSGAEAFWTTKCSFNDENPWLLATFWWQGVDGSRIFTHQFAFNWWALLDLKKYYRAARFPTAGSEGRVLSSRNTPEELDACLNQSPAGRSRLFPFFYGWGDGGKGPLPHEVGITQVLAQLGVGKHGSTELAFAKLKREFGDRLLVWDDEMFMENHRGTKTSVSAIKALNRRCESWLAVAERVVATINAHEPGAFPPNHAELHELWRRVLFNQFHDVLPGSSIPEVYVAATRELREVVEQARATTHEALSRVPRVRGRLVVFNPSSWPRGGTVSRGGRLLDVGEVPGLSIKVVDEKSCVVKASTLLEPKIEERAGRPAFVLENEFVRAAICAETGALASLALKDDGRELIDPAASRDGRGGGLRVFRSKPRRWKAWNMDRLYPRKAVPVRVADPPRVERDEAGAPWVVTGYAFLGSEAKVGFRLLPGSRVLELVVDVHCRDPYLLVKYFVPLALRSDDVTCEVPYAATARRRRKVTPYEKAKWEFSAQRWVDVSDADAGLTIVNRERYGLSATPKGVYLTVVHTHPYTKPTFHSTRVLFSRRERKRLDVAHMDVAPLSFSYGLVPHAGDWRSSMAWRAGEEFNVPLVVDDGEGGGANAGGPGGGAATGDLGKALELPLVEISNPRVVLGALKFPEWSGPGCDRLDEPDDWTWDGRSLVVRLVECSGAVPGQPVRVRFNARRPLEAAWEVDLLERPPGRPVPVEAGGALLLEFGPFEIKTLRVRFGD